jgi:hypothetical protein
MKFQSGRLWFTLIAAVLLYHGTIIGKFSPDKVLDIIKDIVIFYFVVKQTLNAGGQNVNK